MDGRSALTGAPEHAAYASELDRSGYPNQRIHSRRPASTDNALASNCHRDNHDVSVRIGKRTRRQWPTRRRAGGGRLNRRSPSARPRPLGAKRSATSPIGLTWPPGRAALAASVEEPSASSTLGANEQRSNGVPSQRCVALAEAVDSCWRGCRYPRRKRPSGRDVPRGGQRRNRRYGSVKPGAIWYTPPTIADAEGRQRCRPWATHSGPNTQNEA